MGHRKPREGWSGPSRQKLWFLLIQLVIAIWNHF